MKKLIFVSIFLLVLGISALAFTQNSAFTHYLLNIGLTGSEQTAKTEPDRKEQSIKTDLPDSQVSGLTN